MLAEKTLTQRGLGRQLLVQCLMLREITLMLQLRLLMQKVCGHKRMEYIHTQKVIIQLRLLHIHIQKALKHWLVA